MTTEFKDLGFFTEYLVNGKLIGTINTEKNPHEDGAVGYHSTKEWVAEEDIVFKKGKRIKANQTYITRTYPLCGKLINNSNNQNLEIMKDSKENAKTEKATSKKAAESKATDKKETSKAAKPKTEKAKAEKPAKKEKPKKVSGASLVRDAYDADPKGFVIEEHVKKMSKTDDPITPSRIKGALKKHLTKKEYEDMLKRQPEAPKAEKPAKKEKAAKKAPAKKAKAEESKDATPSKTKGKSWSKSQAKKEAEKKADA